MSSTSSETKKWKDKYYNALSEMECLEASAQEDRTLYNQALTRLSLATKGYNENLDPHLLLLRKQLKQKTLPSQTKEVIVNFSEALLNFSDIQPTKSNDKDASLLFKYLLSKELNQATTRRIKSLQTQYEANELTETKQLIALLTEACDPIDEQTEDLTPITKKDNNQHISEQFIHVLQGLDLPETFITNAHKIIKSLQNEQADDFQKNIQIALEFLQEFNVHNQNEKQEMELFLSQVTLQLANLDENTRNVTHAVQQVMVKRNNLDQTVSKQVQSLQNNSENTTQLEPLKSLVKSELENISKQIKRHQQEEKQLQDEVEKKISLMSAEIEGAKKENDFLKERLKQTSMQAVTDVLTNLPNRIAYDQRFDSELARWHRNKTPFSLLVWDIDFFKKINDTYGHTAGDKTLIIIAKLLKQHCRATDFVSRFGGEEFTMILSETNKKSALILATKIRKTIEASKFNSGGESINITISCGIAEIQDNDTQRIIFDRADKALYHAKKNGRNQCIIAS